MKRILLLTALVIGLGSCKKDKLVQPRHPEMTYIDLTSKVVNITTPAGIDINGDGASDVWFEIFHTRDQNLKKDVHRFVVSSSEESRLLVNNQQVSPILNVGQSIVNIQNSLYEWKNPVQTELARRSLTEGVVNWEGAWINAQHQYLAVQFFKNGAVYNGWVELTFDTAKERIVLYRSAISKQAGVEVMAGK